MKRNLILRKIVVVFSAVILLGFCGVSVDASDDLVPYSFDLKPCCENSYSSPRYRQTKNTNNKWKVELCYTSGRARRDVTFWLTRKSDDLMVSSAKIVTQGSGAKYYKANKSANQSYVCLSAENTSYVLDDRFTASGYWDEETN